MIFIGIDNGSSGSIAVLDEAGRVLLHCSTPVKHVLNYTKSVKKWVNRVDVDTLKTLLQPYAQDCKLVMERPAVNSFMQRINTTILAARAFEATLIALEQLGISTDNIIDSKRWQKAMLPGVEGRNELKAAALDRAKKLYPALKITKDTADSLIMAEWYRRVERGIPIP